MDKGLETCDKCDYFISVEESYNAGYEKGRVDAIDEVYEILKKEYYYGFRTPPNSKQRIVDMIVSGFFTKLRQLKEKA